MMQNISDEQFVAAIKNVCDAAVAIDNARECHECGGAGWIASRDSWERDPWQYTTCDHCGGAGKIDMYDAFADDLRELAESMEWLVEKCLTLRKLFTKSKRQ